MIDKIHQWPSQWLKSRFLGREKRNRGREAERGVDEPRWEYALTIMALFLVARDLYFVTTSDNAHCSGTAGLQAKGIDLRDPL